MGLGGWGWGVGSGMGDRGVGGWGWGGMWGVGGGVGFGGWGGARKGFGLILGSKICYLGLVFGRLGAASKGRYFGGG